MRQIVQNTFGRPITIELLERLSLPPSSSGTSSSTNTNSHTTSTLTTGQVSHSNVVLNQPMFSQPSQGSPVLQQPLYTTVQPQQKINILQQNAHPALLGSTASLLSQQQQQQQQARTQIVRELLSNLSRALLIESSS